MGWAAHYIAKLKEGGAVQFRPRGASMRGRIESGQLVTVEPVNPATLGVGDIVLRPMMWLARHAKVAVSGVCYGQSDVPTVLSAEDAARALLEAIAHAKVGAVSEVWTSTTRRTEPVAALVAARLGARLHRDARIAELAMGEWEGRPFAAIERDDGARYQRWMKEWRTESPPGGETLTQLVARVTAWAAERSGEPVEGARLVVSHAGVIRALRALASGRTYEEEMAQAVEHLAIERVAFAELRR
jgi:alpha-ribazole phosphatase